MTEAKIRVEGIIKGTCWLVDSQHVITAAHCVGDLGTSVELLFLNQKTRSRDIVVNAAVVVTDKDADGALLRLERKLDELELPRIVSSQSDSIIQWTARGFPSVAEDCVDVVEVQGTAKGTTFLKLQGRPQAIQLNLSHGSISPEERYDESGNKLHALGGLSGSAVCIREGPEKGSVVAIVRCSFPGMPQDFVYATPLDSIWSKFSEYLPDTKLHQWNRTTGGIRMGDDGRTVLSSIDPELVFSAWSENTVKEITVDMDYEGDSPLIDAVLRVVLHQPGISHLHVRNYRAWNHRLRRHAEDWIGLAQFSPDTAHYPAEELLGGYRGFSLEFADAASAAMAIHEACDRFVLSSIRDFLSLLFEAENPRDYATFHIAPDVLGEMKRTWKEWRKQLESDASLLHHFLAQTLTHNSEYNSTVSASPGAGPLTLTECILPAVIFGLAIAPFFPQALIPAGMPPGNLGFQMITGHSCGIQAVRRESLDLVLRDHQWNTQIVLLKHLQYLPPELQIATGTLISQADAPRPTLTRPAPSAVIITCDRETRKAIGLGVPQLKAHLDLRQQEQNRRELNYVARAVDAK